MDALNLYQEYFAAECTLNEIPRRAVRVMLTAESGGGQICYKAAVNFFRHEDAEDFCIQCDGYFEQVLYQAKGRRSKKREAEYLSHIREYADALASAQNGRILWEQTI
ncbi:MAG: hypothetical protein IK130_07740 [Oscillospiraceae bacterium]|nr:hypothetical protein [Oscillospiraceae bacterium]